MGKGMDYVASARLRPEPNSVEAVRAVSDNGKRWRIVPVDGDWEMQPVGHITAGQAERLCKRIEAALADGGAPVPDREGADGTERLCRALYGRKATARDYLGGSDARMLHDAADRLEEAYPEEQWHFLEWIRDTLQEINPSNYDHDDACRLNDASVEVILAVQKALDARSPALENSPASLADANKNPPSCGEDA